MQAMSRAAYFTKQIHTNSVKQDVNMFGTRCAWTRNSDTAWEKASNIPVNSLDMKQLHAGRAYSILVTTTALKTLWRQIVLDSGATTVGVRTSPEIQVEVSVNPLPQQIGPPSNL